MVWGFLLRSARLSLGYMRLVWGRMLLSAHLILGVIYPVGFFIYFLNISLVCEKPVPASQQAPAFLFLQPGSMWYVM